MKIKMVNVIKAPKFDTTDAELMEGWLERRDAPGLWADISGEFMTITLPSSSIRYILIIKLKFMVNLDNILR